MCCNGEGKQTPRGLARHVQLFVAAQTCAFQGGMLTMRVLEGSKAAFNS